ncbi:MAG: hypothetical protein M4579_002080 [Chaenotheca gracillima]|nr:MAG: hypothetical protein M4579_002080 [Chaenotheca gracillima]
MSQDDDAHSAPNAAPAQASGRRRVRDYFTIPPPVKRLFDRFPLVIYAPNELPASSPQRRRDTQTEQLHTLYIFSTREDARHGRPSFNPTCLKWQAYLMFKNVAFAAIASNNHASPSGALPFLLPRPHKDSSPTDPGAPIPSNKLERWVSKQEGGSEVPYNMRYDAYISLLDHRIRNAWLYNLYLEPTNASVMRRLYIDPCSSSPVVTAAIAHQLRTAAEAEIAKATGSVHVSNIYSEADKAFGALSTLLGEDRWFFGADQPGLFDASVFAYTYQLLTEQGWGHRDLVDYVNKRENLVAHCKLISEAFF